MYTLKVEFEGFVCLCSCVENPPDIMLTPVSYRQYPDSSVVEITERVRISVSRNHTRPVWKVTECRAHECHMTHLIHTMNHH